MTIPLALFMGLYMYKLRPGRIGEATIIGVIGLLLAVVFGRDGRDVVVRRRASRSRATKSIVALGIYGFFASVLPVWLLLAPRDYLSAFMKIGDGRASRRRRHRSSIRCCTCPRSREYVAGGGPIVPGRAVPVRVHHDRLRRDFRVPLARRHRARRRR